MGITALLIVRTLSAPSHGRNVTPEKLTIKRTARIKSETPAATTISNNYFELALPTGYRPQTPSQSGNLLYNQTIIKPSLSGSLVINIGVKTMPEGGLTEDSAYRLRVQQSGRYHFSNQTAHGEAILVANDAESAAVTAFWSHGGYLATVSVTSGLGNPATNDNADELKALNPLLQAWQWR